MDTLRVVEALVGRELCGLKLSTILGHNLQFFSVAKQPSRQLPAIGAIVAIQQRRVPRRDDEIGDVHVRAARSGIKAGGEDGVAQEELTLEWGQFRTQTFTVCNLGFSPAPK